MKKPKLSVGFAVYNGERYLRTALDSLLEQDFEDFELIISDNASTDKTSDICREYAARDKRIRYLRSEENRGATWNHRYLLEMAEGQYFKWAAHDDECYPTMLRRCVEVLDQADSSVALVYTHFEFIDDAGNSIMKDVDPKWDRVATTARTPHQRLAHVIWRNYFGQGIYGVFRVDYLRRASPYGTIVPDWVKMAEMAMLGKIVEVPEVLFRMRRHGANTAVQFRQWKDLLVWHDPGLKGRLPWVSYNTAIVIEYLKAVRHLRLPLKERILCGWVALTTLPFRRAWFRLLRISGSARIRLQALTGWRWLSRTGVLPK